MILTIDTTIVQNYRYLPITKSHLEIIVERRSHALSIHPLTLYMTNYLRTPVDGVARYIEELYGGFRTTFVKHVLC